MRGEIDLGTYGVLGGEIDLLGDWVPFEDSPEQYAQGMLRLAGYLNNTTRPLLRAGQIIRGDIQERFDTETDPGGTPWVPLDPEYLTWKEEHAEQVDILQLTQDLMYNATSPSAFIIESDTLFFDPSGLPEYAVYHQKGSKDQSAVGKAAAQRAARSGKREGGAQKESTGVGRGNALPARPFIGISEKAVGEIVAMFDLWFEDAVTGFTNPRTGARQAWVFTPGGGRRFGPKV